jgi:hypothetical protein|eukprot:1854641-Prymnesium_polylepis.1
MIRTSKWLALAAAWLGGGVGWRRRGLAAAWLGGDVGWWRRGLAAAWVGGGVGWRRMDCDAGALIEAA